MKIHHLSLVGVLLACCAVSARAALVESLNNTVSTGTIVIDSNRSDWNGLTGFVTDPNEGSTVDWHQVTIANDATNYYLRYQMNASEGLDFTMRIFMDTDLNRGTGFIRADGLFSVGADYMIEGGTLYAFAGSNQGDFTWNSLGAVSYDTSVSNDFELSFAQSAVGTSAFNFLLFATGNQPGPSYYEDYYVDDSNTGASGGYLQYTTVPEPGTTLLIGLGLGAVVTCYRRKRA